MRIKIRPAKKKHIPKNICRDFNGPGDYYVYDDLTGWRIFASEAVKMPKYSGVDGMRAHYSYALKAAAGYTPFVPPVEKPIPWTRSGPAVPPDAFPPVTISDRGVFS